MTLTPEQRDVVDRIRAKQRQPDREIVRPTPEQIAARRTELTAAEIERRRQDARSRPPVRKPVEYVDGFCAHDCEHKGPFVRDAQTGYVECLSCSAGEVPPARPVERSYEPSGGLPTVTEGSRASRNDPAYQRAAKLDDAWARTPGERTDPMPDYVVERKP